MRQTTVTSRLERAQGTLRTPSQSPIGSVNSTQETISIAGKDSKVAIGHPVVGENAWIRSIPSTGTQITVQYNRSKHTYDFVAYVPLSASEKVKQYNASNGLYRPLKSGEHEIKSSGNAVSYWGSKCYQITRAGAVSTMHDGEDLNHVSRAPTVHHRGHRNRRDQLGHETRFGVVKRPLSSNKEMIVLKAPLSNPSLNVFNYAYEHSIFVNNDNDDMLIDARLGEVYDDVPQGYPCCIAATGTNGNQLRARVRFGVTEEPLGVGMDDEYTEFEVDNLGNTNITLAKTAVIGFAMVIPQGDYNLTGQTLNFTGKIGISMSAQDGAVELSGKKGVHVTSQDVVTIKAKQNLDQASEAEITITGTKGVTVKSDATITLNGASGVKIQGKMGALGRYINTLNIDPSTGVPQYLDTSLEN